MKKSILVLTILLCTLLPACANPTVNKTSKTNGGKEMKISFNNYSYTAKLADNSSVTALLKMLEEGPLTIKMSDYGNMEKVGALPKSLPRNDEQINTSAGDLILYQGKSFVIYYNTNSWNFTHLGKIDNVTTSELKKALGSGDVTVTLSLE